MRDFMKLLSPDAEPEDFQEVLAKAVAKGVIKSVKKAKGTKIVPKPKSRELTPEEKKKLSPWKLAKQEETMRRVSRIETEEEKRARKLQENLRAKEKLNRNLFTNINEIE